MLERRPNVLVASIVLITLTILLSSGCTKTVSKLKVADNQNIHPSKEMKALFDAVKKAERVIIIDPEASATLNDRDQVALSVFNPQETEYWKLLNDVVTAKKNMRKPEKGHIYIMRWYKKYKKLGEIAIDNKSGVVEVNIPEPKGFEKVDITKPVYHLFVSPGGLLRINKAATINRIEQTAQPQTSTTEI